MNFIYEGVSLNPVLTIRSIYACVEGRHYLEYLCGEDSVDRQRSLIGLEKLIDYRIKIGFTDDQVKFTTPYAKYILDDKREPRRGSSTHRAVIGTRRDAEEEIREFEKCKPRIKG